MILPLARRLKAGNRTPDEESLEEDIFSLRNLADEVQAEVGMQYDFDPSEMLDGLSLREVAHEQFYPLNQETMRHTVTYLAKKFSKEPNIPSQELHARGVEGFGYDVCHELVRRAICKSLCDGTDWISAEGPIRRFEDSQILVDGILGTLYYNPGTAHARRADADVIAYVGHHGKNRFREGFGIVRDLHLGAMANAMALSEALEEEQVGTVETGPLLYRSAFTQGSDIFGTGLVYHRPVMQTVLLQSDIPDGHSYLRDRFPEK